jgi:CubicO group peptidase (beta-lactamase class C family)
MTKPITGMCAMALIEDGLLELDQPLYDILPAWRDMMVQVEYDGAISEDNLEPAKSPVTIRQLLTHTAGIGYGIIQQGPISQAFMEKGLIPGQVSRLPIPGLDRGDPVESLEAFADGMAAMPLVYQPGTKWSYSAGLDVLGRAIEVAEGKPFDQVLHDRIFGPCGMESTWFQVPASERTRLTTNYGVDENGPQPIDPAAISIYLDRPPFPMGGAGLVSSPRDYDRFLNMLLNYGKLDGKQVFPEAAVRKGTSNILPETVDLTGSWTEGQGFGAGGRVVDGSFGWGGAAGTLAAVSYKYGLRTGLFTQYMESSAYPLRDEYMAALEADLAAMAAARQAA